MNLFIILPNQIEPQEKRKCETTFDNYDISDESSIKDWPNDGGGVGALILMTAISTFIGVNSI